MVLLIIRKEILENILTLKFLFLSLFCVVLIPLSLYFNANTYKTGLNDYREAVRLNEEQLKTVYARNYPEKMKGYRPPSELMVFARGLEDHLPHWVTATKTGPDFGMVSSGRDAMQVFITNMDYHFIVRFIFSLIALLFSFNLICGEKERGTLRQNLSNAVPRHHILLGKIIGNYLVLIIPLVLSLLFGLLLLSFMSPEILSGGNLPPICSIVTVSFVYIAVFFMIGLAVTTRTRDSITALVVLLFLWILVVFVLPGTATIMARILHPVKTEQVLNLEKELLQRQVNREKSDALMDVYREYQNPGSGGEPDAFSRYLEARKPIALAFEARERQELANLDRDFRLENQRQERLGVILSSLSPVPVFSYIVTDFANTGLAYKNAVYSSALNYNITMDQEVYSKMWRDEYILGETSRASQGGYYEMPPLEVSKYRFPAPSFTGSFGSSWMNILLLVIYGVLFFVISYVGFLKYDVR